jgi:hypothetical protein
MNALPKRRPTISELEALLRTDEEVPIEILPNGEIRAIGAGDRTVKPLTYREQLGGEYGIAA